MPVPSEANAIKRTARFAGLLYLTIFIAVPASYIIGRAGVPVAGNAAETAAGVIASETLFRVGMAAETIVFLVEIVLAALLYFLLRPVNQALSLAAAFARLGEAVVQGVNLITSAMVLLLVGGAGYLSVFEPDQLAALAALSLDLNAFVIILWGVFFGFHLLLLGYLVYKSEFWPRIIGVLLVLGSLGYLVQSYGHMVAPQYDAVLSAVVVILAVPGELAFTVWLLWKGIDVERWQARARASA